MAAGWAVHLAAASTAGDAAAGPVCSAGRRAAGFHQVWQQQVVVAGMVGLLAGTDQPKSLVLPWLLCVLLHTVVIEVVWMLGWPVLWPWLGDTGCVEVMQQLQGAAGWP